MGSAVAEICLPSIVITSLTGSTGSLKLWTIVPLTAMPPLLIMAAICLLEPIPELVSNLIIGCDDIYSQLKLDNKAYNSASRALFSIHAKLKFITAGQTWVCMFNHNKDRCSLLNLNQVRIQDVQLTIRPYLA